MNASSVRRVLIVDDSREDRAIVRRMLRQSGAGFHIREAATGAQGLEEARREVPDCILLDFRLPDMNAPEFLDALGTASGSSATAGVAILTGFDDADDAARALGRGAQDYVIKDTLTPHGLRRLVENAIEKAAIRRELTEQRATLEQRNRQLETIRAQLEDNLAELVDATRAKDRFMAVMSHEMRTPLNAVLGYVDLLEMGIAGELNDAQREYLERIRIGSRHLLDLINDVLDLARADARRLDLDIRPVDVLAIVEEVAALLEREAAAKGLTLAVHAPADSEPPLVQADLQRLRQILTNLVGNAIKFTDEGRIEIRCRADAQQVEVEVADTGIGIDPEVLPLIFTEFFQADAALTRRQGGSGLGLAISQRLAQLMGGEIRVQSRVGEGSTFTLRLPRAEPGSTARPEDVERHGTRMQEFRTATAQTPAVVVAYGDSVESLEELSRRVDRGVRLVWTTDAEQVASLAHREGASLIVLDIGCNNGVGWEAAHALREDPELSSVAVLLLPCIPLPHSEDESGGLDLGWVTLVPKPFTSDQLTRAVHSAARGTRAAGAEAGPDGIDVLIVDDDADSRRVAARFLQGGPVRVREVDDGETALAEMRRHPPDVVVLDLMMPVLDGFGVLAAMRADPLLTRIPVVVLSAKSLNRAEREFLARSAVRVLQKGEHRLSDVAELVLRAAAGSTPPPPSRTP